MWNHVLCHQPRQLKCNTAFEYTINISYNVLERKRCQHEARRVGIGLYMWDGKCLPMSTDKGAEPAELTDAREYGRPFFSFALMSTKLAANAPSYLLIRHWDSHCRHRVTSAYRISVLIFFNVTFLRLICQLCTLSPSHFRPLGVILGSTFVIHRSCVDPGQKT